jgi:RNA polymerase sigma-70 factor, Bacteroides expansion family 1
MVTYRALSDTELVALLNKSDQLAYTEIFERYKQLLYRHAFRILNDHEVVNDIIQELFLAIWQKRETLVIHSSLTAYLFQSVRNRIFDWIAHQRVESKYLQSIHDFAEKAGFITDETIRARELNRIIEKEIASLPPKMRTVFDLSRETDLTYKEIGEQLNISDKTVKQQVYNAVKILRLKINSFLFFIHL